MSSFFKKIGKDVTHAFKKTGDVLNSTFKKGGTAEKFVNKVGRGIDTGLKTVADVAKQAGKYAGQAGKFLTEAAPAAALIPGIGPEIAAGMIGAGGLARKIGKASDKAQKITGKLQEAKANALNPIHNTLEKMPNPPALAEPPVEFV